MRYTHIPSYLNNEEISYVLSRSYQSTLIE